MGKISNGIFIDENIFWNINFQTHRFWLWARDRKINIDYTVLNIMLYSLQVIVIHHRFGVTPNYSISFFWNLCQLCLATSSLVIRPEVPNDIGKYNVVGFTKKSDIKLIFRCGAVKRYFHNFLLNLCRLSLATSSIVIWPEVPCWLQAAAAPPLSVAASSWLARGAHALFQTIDRGPETQRSHRPQSRDTGQTW